MRKLILILPLLFSLQSFSQLNINQSFDVKGWDTPHRIIQLSNGNYALTGTADSEVFFLVVDQNGNEIIKKTYPRNDNDHGFEVYEISDGYILQGENYIYGEPGYWEPFISRLDSLGNEVWFQVQDSFNELNYWTSAPARGLIVDETNQTITIALKDTIKQVSFQGTNIQSFDYSNMTNADFLPRYFGNDFNGKPILIGLDSLHLRIFKLKTDFTLDNGFNAPKAVDYIAGVIESSDNGYVIVGTNLLPYENRMQKLNVNGIEQWSISTDISSFHPVEIQDVKELGNEFIITGWHPFGNKTRAFVGSVFKHTGQVYWMKTISNIEAAASTLLINSNNQIVVSGQKTINSANKDIFISTEDTTGAIWVGTDDIFDTKTKINFFPNPAHSFIVIDGIDDSFHYQIFNTQGMLIEDKFNNTQKIDVSNLSNGMYFLRIYDEDKNYRLAKFIKN